MMGYRILIVGAGATLCALAGCGTVAKEAPDPRVMRVEVPVAVPCIREKPERPVYRTGVEPWPGDKAAALILAEDFEAAQRYGLAWEAAAAGCEVKDPP